MDEPSPPQKSGQKETKLFPFHCYSKETIISVKVLIVASSVNKQGAVSGKSKSDTHFIFNIWEFRRNQRPNLCIWIPKHHIYSYQVTVLLSQRDSFMFSGLSTVNYQTLRSFNITVRSPAYLQRQLIHRDTRRCSKTSTTILWRLIQQARGTTAFPLVKVNEHEWTSSLWKNKSVENTVVLLPLWSAPKTSR